MLQTIFQSLLVQEAVKRNDTDYAQVLHETTNDARDLSSDLYDIASCRSCWRVTCEGGQVFTSQDAERNIAVLVALATA